MNAQDSRQKLIAGYITDIRNRGSFLAYSDYEVIETWLKIEADPERLLVVLDDILPDIFNRIPIDRHPPRLKYFEKVVKDRLLVNKIGMEGSS